jgi:hypothetical protein
LSDDFDCTDTLDGLKKLSQKEITVSMDELMSRRKLRPDQLKWLVAAWRQDRVAWKNKKDEREDRKEGVEE